MIVLFSFLIGLAVGHMLKKRPIKHIHVKMTPEEMINTYESFQVVENLKKELDKNGYL